MTNARNPLLEKLDPAAEATMRSLIGGALRTQALYVAAKLGIADQLSLGARTAADLAQRVEADESSLKRLLRFLVFHGVFVEDEEGRFLLNRAAESLQSGHPRSLRPSAIRAGEGLWEVSSRLLNAVQTGRTPHDELHGMTFFERAATRDGGQAFGSRMSSSTAGLGTALAALESVQRAQRIVDVGGGHGAVLAEILHAQPHLRGVVLDRAEVLEGARSALCEGDLLDRCELVAGDFMESVPAGADVYLLSWILHDWNDAQALRILRACRDAALAGTTLLIVEVMLPPQVIAREGADPGVVADPYMLDLQMLLLTGGRERTAREYGALLQEAGFSAVALREIPSARGAAVVEATRSD